MKAYLLKSVSLVNEDSVIPCDVLIKNGRFERIDASVTSPAWQHEVIDCEGYHLLPGLIDVHLHFREPGLTHKADIATDTRAAIAGGVTSFMEMPNTKPPAISVKDVQEKYEIASRSSSANYGFYIGATHTNLEELKRAADHNICGIKVFMGSSTGNMLVDDPDTLNAIFASAEIPVAVHAETESIIAHNLEKVERTYQKPWPFNVHPVIRSRDGCYTSSSQAVSLAQKHGTRLHVLHLTTREEIALFANERPEYGKHITTEVCPHYLFFDDRDYPEKGGLVKCNPAIKTAADREALIKALSEDRIDLVSSDHAPHTTEEKANTYNNCPSGMPMVQHSLGVLLELHQKGHITLPQIVRKMAHNPARIFRIANRGFVREGYYADAALLNLQKNTSVNKDTIRSKCGWSPFEGHTFPGKVETVFVNGTLTYDQGRFTGESNAMALDTGTT